MTDRLPHWVLQAEEIRKLHLIGLQGRAGLAGERPESVVESASALALQAAVYAAAEDSREEPDHLVYVSHLFRNIVGGHGFIDGNKRAGLLALTASLALDGLEVNATNEELEQFTNHVAGEGEDPPGPRDIAAWLAPRLVAKR